MLGDQKRHEVFLPGLLELNRAEEERSSWSMVFQHTIAS
jgi:hypothetical protein